MDASLETLWKHVLDHWDDEKAHGTFLEHCQRTGSLAEAAVLYRGMKGDRERGPIAEKRLAGVAVLALTTLEASRSAPPRGGTSGVVLLAAFIFATLGLMAYLWLS